MIDASANDGGERRGAARGEGVKVLANSPTATGKWKIDPAVARSVLGLNGSTEWPVKTTAVAPAASAERIKRARVSGISYVVQHQDQAVCGDGVHRHHRQPHRREDGLRGGGVRDLLQNPGGE